MAIECNHCGNELENRGSICDLCVCGGEIIRSFWSCRQCGRRFYNEYYDCWDRDSDDIWHEIPEKAFNNGLEVISRCPDRASKFCSCPVHPFSADLTDAVKVDMPRM